MRRIKLKETVLNEQITFEIPSRCEYCDRIFISPLVILAKGYTSNLTGALIEHGTYYFLIKCSYCEEISLLRYNLKHDRKTKKFIPFAQRRNPHSIVHDDEFPELINQISPRFIRVYSQSFKAEKDKLDELAGMGYRKSLEILVKDYTIAKYPTKEKQIAKMPFQKALSLIDNHEIKILGQVGQKIGNDLTHYYQKHDWPISDLKNYIEIIVNFINSDFSIEEARYRLNQDNVQKS